MTGYLLDAYHARRLWNFLRLMEVRGARLRDVWDEANELAAQGKMVP